LASIKFFARLSVNIESSQNLYVSNKFVKKNSIKPQQNYLQTTRTTKQYNMKLWFQLCLEHLVIFRHVRIIWFWLTYFWKTNRNFVEFYEALFVNRCTGCSNIALFHVLPVPKETDRLAKSILICGIYLISFLRISGAGVEGLKICRQNGRLDSSQFVIRRKLIRGWWKR
jgi:hypothetical protein